MAGKTEEKIERLRAEIGWHEEQMVRIEERVVRLNPTPRMLRFWGPTFQERVNAKVRRHRQAERRKRTAAGVA